MKHKNIKDYLASQYPHHTWVPVHERSIRSVYRLDRDGVPEYFVKIYAPVTCLEKLRNLIRQRTAREKRMLTQLKEAGILVPEVHDHVRFHASSALVTRAVFPAQPVYEIEPERQSAIMAGLALELLNKGFFFSDMHVGNIILDSRDRPFLLDAYEITPCKKITREQVVSLFAQVLNNVDITDDELRWALKRLNYGYDLDDLAGRIRTRFHRLRRRYVKKRVNRSLHQGSFSREIARDGTRAWVRRGYTLDLDEMIAGHRRNIRENKGVLKFQEKTQLSQVGEYCVKTYKSAKLMCSPYALRSWKGLLTLYYNRVGAAEPVAVAVFRDKSSVLITRMLAYPDFDVFLWKNYADLTIQEKREIARAFGRTMGCLHSLNIYHADLKACNIKIERHSRKFYFLDTDRIVQKSSISYASRLKNLVQINTSIPLQVSRSLRMTFLKAYSGYTRDDPRVLFKEVWDRSSREEILFCTSDGDRIEAWP